MSKTFKSVEELTESWSEYGFGKEFKEKILPYIEGKVAEVINISSETDGLELIGWIWDRTPYAFDILEEMPSETDLYSTWSLRFVEERDDGSKVYMLSLDGEIDDLFLITAN